MITKASELLSRFIDAEREKLKGVAMPHMPTLGSAYEEITKQGIDSKFVIPKFLNLSVVSGFIEVDGKMLSEQIDCMLVEGSGKQYGITNQYIYDIEHVLCIFEVKKTLNKSDYLDAFEHLGKIRSKFAEYFEKKLLDDSFEPDISHARIAFSQITGKMAPEFYSGIHNLSKADGMLFYTLVQEQHAPISIVHGYDGYKTESGLRGAFVKIIEERSKISGAGLGVPSFPTLVTSNNFCIIKGNGHPYLAIRDGKSWVAVLSTRHNPAKIILELIWSKISSHFNVRMPFGTDLDMEVLVPLLIAEPQRIGDKLGWVYKSIEYKENRLARDETTAWEPEKLGPAEMSAINIMFAKGGYLPLDKEMADFLIKKYNCHIDQVVFNLTNSRIFAKDGGFLRPISNMTHVLSNVDDSGYVANDRNRFDAWCVQQSIEPTYMNMFFLD